VRLIEQNGGTDPLRMRSRSSLVGRAALPPVGSFLPIGRSPKAQHRGLTKHIPAVNFQMGHLRSSLVAARKMNSSEQEH
jgi:hypothetical protein